MERKLEGQVAVITGASSGIGAGAAKLFAREGAKVVLFARRPELLQKMAADIRSQGGECIAVAGDVTSQEDCSRVIRETIAAFGRIDILVNNAGEGDHHSTTRNTDDELWYQMIELNQSSVFRFCREVLPIMEQQSSGIIVNISAIAGVYGNAGVSYSAAKAGVIGITKNIAIQYAGRGIRCNVLCPGPTNVPRMDGREADLFDKQFMAITERHMDMTIPFSQVEDQANVILFLASIDSKCLTGQVIVSDNGMCM